MIKPRPVTLAEINMLEEMLESISGVIPEDVLMAEFQAAPRIIDTDFVGMVSEGDYLEDREWAHVIRLPSGITITVSTTDEVDSDNDPVAAPADSELDEQAQKLLAFITTAPLALRRLLEYARARMSD